MIRPTAENPKNVTDTVNKPLKDGGQVSIRRVKEKDLQELSELYVKVYTADGVGEKLTPADATKTLEYLYDKNPALALVAEVEGKIVGGNFCDVENEKGQKALDVKEIFVDPQMQYKEIGEQLMAEGICRAEKFYDTKEIGLITFAKGHAGKFYESFGLKSAESLVLMNWEVKEVVSSLKNKVRERAEGGTEAKK